MSQEASEVAQEIKKIKSKRKIVSKIIENKNIFLVETISNIKELDVEECDCEETIMIMKKVSESVKAKE